MKKITIPPFVKMCWWGISGAFLGIMAGTLLGALIYLIQFLLISLTSINNSEMVYNNGNTIWQHISQPVMLGTSFGALLGAIFGSIFGLKEISKK